jgi:hypothetical protein
MHRKNRLMMIPLLLTLTTLKNCSRFLAVLNLLVYELLKIDIIPVLQSTISAFFLR